LKKLISQILHAIYPTKCIFCGEMIKDTPMRICDKCVKDLPYNKKYCQLCGKPIDSVYGKPLCGECLGTKKSFERVFVPFVYKDKVRNAIIAFKFKDKRSFGKTLAILLFAELKKSGYFPDAVTYVPIHFWRKAKRGYNQTKIIADEIAAMYGVPVIALLKKAHYTKKLAFMSAKDRRETVKGSFKAIGGVDMPGKNILLVDDIITTASTITECAKTIKKEYKCNLSVAMIAAAEKR